MKESFLILLGVLIGLLGIRVEGEFTTFEKQEMYYLEVKELVEKCESIGGTAEVHFDARVFFDECHIK